jgi:aspartyl protease family protein
MTQIGRIGLTARSLSAYARDGCSGDVKAVFAAGVRSSHANMRASTMRHILIFAAAVLLIGSYGARFADRAMNEAPHAAAVRPVAQTREPEPYSSGHSTTLDSDRQGHFRTEARIEGRRLDFIVDSGASLVILRESDAASVGIRPLPMDFTATVSTANGKLKAAPAKLARIEIGDITVFDVPALVLPDEALAQNLLGVSFLSRLKRYEYANGRMVLEQ